MSLRFKTDCLIGSDMTDLASFRSIIELWPSREAMATELGAGAPAVSKWWQRDSVPAEWWSAMLATETASTNCVTAELLTALAAREVVEARA
jgi:hypothetical protein